MSKLKFIHEYVIDAKIDKILYIFMACFLFILLFLISYQNNFYGYFVFEVIFLLKVFEKSIVYKNSKKIEETIKNTDLNIFKEKVLFWNEDTLFLTDNHIIVLYDGKVGIFKYQEITNVLEDKKAKMIEISVKNKEKIYLDLEKKYNIKKVLLEKINQ